MYKRESGGWLKHYDFLLLDMMYWEEVSIRIVIYCTGRWRCI